MNITREEPDGDVVDAAVRIDVRRFIISLAVVVGIVECLAADDSVAAARRGLAGILTHDCLQAFTPWRSTISHSTQQIFTTDRAGRPGR